MLYSCTGFGGGGQFRRAGFSGISFSQNNCNSVVVISCGFCLDNKALLSI
ncbi:unnamed protein product [Schistosoma mattheei]|uniref:Uncharacterized protein n=1 Tax=Schistosoma mattheei TaxID=31246 RepID=A0A183NGK8_9TREM|nr:unnamed protein product [Schistosoma mattheei]